ncbi:MAG: pyridoxal-phosphate dependent enzyme [Candidatus Obscuribacterales bacterium]|nr:pyridoxal-phosphate dependent enzyme [Candidatus Obscuribacterales bacterium]
MLVRHVSELIGNTPLFEISPEIHGLKNINLYAKLELLNPFGSVKDKSAWQVLKDDIEQVAKEGKTVIESSSGNMAKAMQLICSIYNVPFKIVTNRIKVREVKQILQLLGAEVDELPGLSECPDPTDPNDPVTFIEQIMSASPGKYFHTSQYTNEKNIKAHYESTGREIAEDLNRVDFFIGGLGTTGSTRGAGSILKEKNPQMKNVGVIASKGHLLPGIRNVDEMYEVGLFRKDFYDDIVEVNIDESMDAMLTLIRKCGILAGPTGGGSLAAALKYLQKIDSTLTSKQNAVFIVCDRVEWYLSYLQKCRPEIFGLSVKQDSVKAVPAQDLETAPEVTLEQAETWLTQNPRPFIVDMRGSLAFKASRIPGSINIPADNLEDISDMGVPFANGHKVLFVCPTGDQSKRYAAYFAKQGVECASLKGGFVAWRDANKNTERSAITRRSKVLTGSGA